MSLGKYTITVAGDQLSDLWFNYAHDNYEKLENDASEIDLRRAIEADAEEFLVAAGYSAGTVNPDFKEALVEDFLKRL